MKKKAWQMYRKRWKVPEILSLRIFPDEADYRSWIRKQTMQKGHIISSAKDEKAESVYGELL